MQRTDAATDRLGLVGMSLGGGLVLEYAETTGAGQVKAVVDFFGYIPDPNIYAKAAKLPPTIVFHSKKDMIVNIKTSEDLVEALKKNNVEHDHGFYPDGDPNVFHHPFAPGSDEDVESRDRAITWLKAHL
jgi:dienelactone hydrolase